MLPKINNKELIDCEASDFEVLLNNPDYRENQYLEYKQEFDQLRIPKEKQVRDEKIAELRNDICSFANAGETFFDFVREEGNTFLMIEAVVYTSSNISAGGL